MTEGLTAEAVLPPEGTRLILASENLLEQFGTRTEHGDLITAEWGEPDENGWYTPTFRVHYDDNPAVQLARQLLAAQERVAALEAHRGETMRMLRAARHGNYTIVDLEAWYESVLAEHTETPG